ncbi:MAG: ATP-binding protein [Mariniblastus sp.]
MSNKSSKPQSLQSQIFFRIAPLAALALLAAIFINGYFVSQALNQEIQARVDKSAINAGHQVEVRLNTIIEATTAVAQNDMVVNGIVDLEHRNSTLQSYFRSLKLPGTSSQQVSMTDYKGRVLASTNANASDRGSEAWFSDVMSGKRHLGMMDRTLTVAVPVLYSNRAEGSVVTACALDEFVAQHSAVPETSALVFHTEDSVIYSTDATIAPINEDFVVDNGWLYASAEIDGLLDLRVSFLESKESALKAARDATRSQLIQSGVLLTGLLGVIWLAARLATRPSANLLTQIETIQNTRDLSLRVSEVGPSEFVDLGKGFNAMLSEVERTTVSQEEYRLSQERFENAVRGTRDGIWDWDLQTNKTWYASRYRELLGYGDSEEDFPSEIESFANILHPDDQEATWNAVSFHQENDTEFSIEHRLRTKGGAYKWFRSRGASVRDETGKAIRMSGSIQDISERKGFEQAILQSNQDLEQFASIASHDLQEPLRKVASFCDLLRQDYSEQLDDNGKKYLDFAVDGATRMRSLIQDLLIYSRIGSEKHRSIKIDSNTALTDAISNLDASIKESGATITHDQLPDVFAEPRELSQLFQNLIGNSIKYRSEEAPTIHISSEALNGFWKFEISDNGIGIEPQYRDRIFGIFKRLHSHAAYPGTGIGLAICKRIVDQLQGKIWVANTEGSGCTVCFTIPQKMNKGLLGPNQDTTT